MTQVSALEFKRKFGEIQDMALREPVEITRHGRRFLVIMSAEQFDLFKAVQQKAHKTTEAIDLVAEAVERAEMDPRHAALDETMR
jgi:prevent-host-death family protein